MEFERGETKKVYLTPEDFPELIHYEQLQHIMEHQREAFERGEFTEEPLPETDDESLLQAYEAFAENRELYEGDIDEAIETDYILEAIRPKDLQNLTPEKARSIRIRSSVVAAQKVLIKEHVKIVPNEMSDQASQSDPRVA